MNKWWIACLCTVIVCTVNAQDKTILVISDLHLDVGKGPLAGKGQGTDSLLWHLTRQKIEKLLKGGPGRSKPDAIICLGDLPAHTDDPAIRKFNIVRALRDLRTMATAHAVPLFYIPGNNDALKGDYHLFDRRSFAEDTAATGYWPMVGLSPVLTDPDAPYVLNEHLYGYYSAYPFGTYGKKHLRLLAMNTSLFTADAVDAIGLDAVSQYAQEQLGWLKKELGDARQRNDAVLIAMHVPPGKDAYQYNDQWSPRLLYKSKEVTLHQAFLQIIADHKQQVIGLISGHSHMDGIRRLYDTAGLMTTLSFSVPGITPQYGNNPGMKLLTLSAQSFDITHAVTLYHPFYPDGSIKQSVWGDSSFDLSKALQCPKDMTLKSHVARLADEVLAGSLYKIYKVHGLKGRNNFAQTVMSMNVYGR